MKHYIFMLNINEIVAIAMFSLALLSIVYLVGLSHGQQK